MTESARTILSVASVREVTAIDAGNTLALRLAGADGGEIVLLVPVGAGEALAGQVTAGLDAATEVRRRWARARGGPAPAQTP